MKDYRDDPDVRLMLRVQKGETEVFAELVGKYQGLVRNTIYRTLGPTPDLEDLAQEAFMKAYRSRERYQPSARFSTWIYRIVYNLCLNAIRNGSRRRMASLDERGNPSDSMDRPTQVIRRNELHELVREAIDQLPPNQRIAVILDKFQDLSYKEIAEVMETSVSAVKSLLSRARENLRRLLAPQLRGYDTSIPDVDSGL